MKYSWRFNIFVSQFFVILKIIFEDFKIYENNIISVEATKVVGYHNIEWNLIRKTSLA
jgi:hypothetical protein